MTRQTLVDDNLEGLFNMNKVDRIIQDAANKELIDTLADNPKEYLSALDLMITAEDVQLIMNTEGDQDGA